MPLSIPYIKFNYQKNKCPMFIKIYLLIKNFFLYITHWAEGLPQVEVFSFFMSNKPSLELKNEFEISISIWNGRMDYK